MLLYLKACRDRDFAQAGEYLDTTDLPPVAKGLQPATMAWQLKVVLDQKLWIDPDDLSDAPEGDVEDGSSKRDRVGTIETDRGDVDVMLERVTDENGLEVWRIASGTVARIPALYQRFGYGPLGEYLPDIFFELVLFRIQLWQWIGLFALLPLTYLASWLALWLVQQTVRPLVSRTRTSMDDRLLGAVLGPARLGLAVALFALGVLVLQLSMPAQKAFNHLEAAAVIVAVCWLALRMIDVSSEILERRLEKENRQAAVSVLPLGRRTVKAIALLFAALAAIQNFGFNVTGILASLGIGGLAIALGAQKSLENLFAGLSLISDQPVRVGDFCRFGDSLGTVEDIGLRSTKIRTLDRSVMAVPNSQFAEMHLDNLSRRDRIRLNMLLGLRYETSADQLRHVLLGVRRMLISHPKVDLEPFWRVRFVGFGDYSLNIEVFVYVKTQDYGEFCGIQEDILLRIMDIVEASGSSFAFPSQTTYLGRDSGLDEDLVRKAEKEIRKLREEHGMPFPDFTDKEMDRIRGQLDYPPEGSVLVQTK